MSSQEKDSERVNDRIRISPIRLIDENGVQVGVVPTEQALDMAFERGLDLVEVQPFAKPPVCKIMDYGKFKYEKTKKARVARKKQHTQTVKEMRFSAKISNHDYGYKMMHIREFLLHSDKVKVTIRFRGREITHIDLGEQVMEKLKEDVADIARVEQASKLDGRTMTMMLGPDNKKISVYERQKRAEEKKSRKG